MVTGAGSGPWALGSRGNGPKPKPKAARAQSLKPRAKVESQVSTAYVIFADGTRIRAEVADTDEARARGLMFHGPVAEDTGMLFVFDRPGRYAFWM
jgi:hypothetical protein